MIGACYYAFDRALRGSICPSKSKKPSDKSPQTNFAEECHAIILGSLVQGFHSLDIPLICSSDYQYRGSINDLSSGLQRLSIGIYNAEGFDGAYFRHYVNEEEESGREVNYTPHVGCAQSIKLAQIAKDTVKEVPSVVRIHHAKHISLQGRK